MQQTPSPPTSGRYANDLVILLSGEETSLPEAEARALILAYDEAAEISSVDDRVILAKTTTHPDKIARRIAYARRVGLLIHDGRLDRHQAETLDRSTYRLRIFRIREGDAELSEIALSFAEQTDARIDLENPDFEISVICGSKTYFALTNPGVMRQDWVSRRPRSRAYFHPAAIFPKFARALVNLTRVREGEVLLDPYVGTGSLLIEGSIVGAECVGVDLSRKMTRGALRNQRKEGQRWLGVVRADSLSSPVRAVDAIVTDVPYGRVSSAAGSNTTSHLEMFVENASAMLRPGKRAVVMHPKQHTVSSRAGLEIEEEHHLYIHRKLTRTITVLRRM